MAYNLQISTSNKRRSVSITVYPNCDVKVVAPANMKHAKLHEIIKTKESWIIKKIEYFKQNAIPQIVKKEYKEGEKFYYLGKEYEIQIAEGIKNKVEMKEGAIIITKTAKANIKTLLFKWFLFKAEEVFTQRLMYNFAIFSKKLKYALPSLQIRKMKSKWGSINCKGLMKLNLSLIHTPPQCIDYVIMHELCHLKYQNHKKEFYLLQSVFTPNYKELRKILNDFNPQIKSM